MNGLSCLVLLVGLAARSALSLPMMRTAPTECPLENGNLLDVHLFISDEAQCKQLCQANEVSYPSILVSGVKPSALRFLGPRFRSC